MQYSALQSVQTTSPQSLFGGTGSTAQIEAPQQSDITLQNRKELHITGIKEVVSYHEGEVLMITSLGALHIYGEHLQIEDLSVANHHCHITGQINGFLYDKTVSDQNEKRGFWSKVFR